MTLYIGNFPDGRGKLGYTGVEPAMRRPRSQGLTVLALLEGDKTAERIARRFFLERLGLTRVGNSDMFEEPMTADYVAAVADYLEVGWVAEQQSALEREREAAQERERQAERHAAEDAAIELERAQRYRHNLAVVDRLISVGFSTEQQRDSLTQAAHDDVYARFGGGVAWFVPELISHIALACEREHVDPRELLAPITPTKEVTP